MTGFFSESQRRDPYPLLARLRASAPVFHDLASNAWMLLRYDDVKPLLQKHESLSSAVSPPGTLSANWLIFADPPRHARLRALIMRAFTSRTIASLESTIHERACALLHEMSSREDVDFVRDFAIPLPLGVIAGLLGVPADDLPQFRNWTDAIVALSHTISGGEAVARAVEDARHAHDEMAAYLPPLIDERRSRPRDDLLSSLAAAEVDGERLSDAELLGFFELVLLAGHETTTNLLSNAVLAFDENPDQLGLLRAAPGLIEPAIEEVLRFRSPVQAVFRRTSRPIDVSGVTIPADVLLLLMLGSANRDPSRFDRADRFDITRQPNPHVAFGHGIHFCIGAPLARLEARIALQELYRRFERVELVDATAWEPREAFHVLGASRLPVRLVTREVGRAALI